MVKEIRKGDAEAYLRKADEFLDAARDNLIKERFNVAGFDAIQAIINGNDALTVYLIGKRASKDHREAIRMHIEAIRTTGDASFRQTVKDALDSRSEVGYSGRLINRSLAVDLVNKATRFLDWVKRYVVI